VPFTPEGVRGVRRFGQLQEVNAAGTGRDALQQGSRRAAGGKENSSPKLMIWGNGFLGDPNYSPEAEGGEGQGEDEAAEEGAATCALRLRSSSLRQLSLWGCSDDSNPGAAVLGAEELSLNCCPALASAACAEQLRSTCPLLRSIHAETGVAAGGDGADCRRKEDGEHEDYEEGCILKHLSSPSLCHALLQALRQTEDRSPG